MSEKITCQEYLQSKFDTCIRNVKNNPDGWDCKRDDCMGCYWYDEGDDIKK